jgi:hypothetical protein
MPLTKKGRKIKSAMVGQYGEKKGTSVFHASQNKGTISGTHRGGRKMMHYGNPEPKAASGKGRYATGRTGASNLGRSMNTRMKGANGALNSPRAKGSRKY